ncbi:DUF4838 domain-containing protein [Paenibacillus eucommiae]|uniref:SLH domain-containing protein n=1 Tax=Paenibacillus eucommiae TaxID=1355755 RepID=A0ABS4IRE0_9BACL|nr:DUF4838 domain-containing protein [Paenibacillus eucommiae]MBP1990139.1 hypothetical protein [Paenibacillus eucommiae]
MVSFKRNIRRNIKKVCMLFLMSCLIYTSFGSAMTTVIRAASDPLGDPASSSSPTSSSPFSDLKGHWAEKQLTAWMEAGLIQGYADGTFKPNRTVNRGEAIALVNRSFGFSERAQIDFSDLAVSDWEYEDVAKAVQAGFIEGYADGTIGAKRTISRQEAAVMIARLLDLDVQAASESASGFTDYTHIPEWSKGAVAAVAAAKIMEGYEDGSFKPLAFITRAEVVVTLERALRLRPKTEYNKAGTYGPAEGVEQINGNVVVSTSGVTLQNMKITGDLLLAEGIAEGDVFLNHVTVQGTTTVKGGGINSIHVANSVLAAVIVDKAAGTVRIVVKDKTTIAEVIVKSAVILEQADSDGSSVIKLVKLLDGISINSKIKLIGYFEHVDAAAKGIAIDFTKGTIKKLSVSQQATGVSINVGKDAKIILMILDAIAKVTGLGVIEKATLSEKAKGTTFETKPLLLEGPADESQGQTDPITGTPVPGGGVIDGGTSTPASIVSVSAVNGTITVTFNAAANIIPEVNDFTVQRVINDATAISVTPSLVAWDSASSIATLTVPTVSMIGIDQSVVDRVRYKGAAAVESAAFVVSAEVVDSNLIVENGIANALIVIETDSSQQILEAAETLREYVKKSTGAELSTKTTDEWAEIEPASNDMVSIYIGVSRTEDEAHHNEILLDMKDDGFIIDSQEENITIIGPTSRGTEFGVYEFLERYVGVRWLMPGPEGEDVPQRSTIIISQEIVRNDPATISRHFFGTETTMSVTNAEWARKNKMFDNVRFHHNMAKLFDPKDSKLKEHPEYYVGGVVPTHDYDWQPCFNDTTAEVATERIISYFEQHPEEMSYSLGMNDSHRFCEDTGVMNSVGLMNMSDVYYPWVNKVVEGVMANDLYKDKYFGLLAYSNMFDPPTNVTLNSHVIPYITEDRMTWIDQSNADISKEALERWEQVATNLAWYEYLYGWPYNIPRVYPHQMAENYKFAQDQGVIAHVAELFPNFGEGPKPWLSAKLQWNADQDVEDLLNEWYERAVGTDAAPYLKEYYQLWEDFWTRRVLDTDWYLRWKTERYYLRFDLPDYLEAVTKKDITDSRLLLEQVVVKAQTSKQKTRAQKLLQAFEFYEASALSYPQSGPIATPVNEQEALELLSDIQISLQMAKKRTNLVKQYKGDPILELPGYPSIMGNWDGVQNELMSALKSYVATEGENGVVRAQLNQFLDSINSNYSANAIRTTTSKAQILQSLDFSKGPWTDAEPFSDFFIMNTRSEGPKTKVYLLWDLDNLYVGYENFDDNPGAMVVSDTAPGGWWASGSDPLVGGDDSVETFISQSGGTIKGFFTNPKAVKFIYNWVPGSEPEPGTDHVWESNSLIKSDRWNTVQVIPFSSIGVDLSKTNTMEGLFFRNYHGHSKFLGWAGGAPWNSDTLKLINLIDGENLIKNGSFEIGGQGNPDAAPPWYIDGFPGEVLKRTSEFSRTGDQSLAVNVYERGIGAAFQDIPITPGKYRATFHYYLPEDSETVGTVFWEANVKNAAYVQLRALNFPSSPIAYTKGRWTKVTVEFEIDPIIFGETPSRLQPIIYFSGFKPGEFVYIDDVSIYKLEPLDLVEKENIIMNGSFEIGGPENPDAAPPWYIDGFPGEVLKRTNEFSLTGDQSLAVNVYERGIGAAFQDLPITPGEYRATFYYFLPEDSEAVGSLFWEVAVKNAGYGLLNTITSSEESVINSKGRWSKVTINFVVNPSYYGEAPARLQPVIYFKGFKQGEYVYIDDVSIYKLD